MFFIHLIVDYFQILIIEDFFHVEILILVIISYKNLPFFGSNVKALIFQKQFLIFLCYSLIINQINVLSII